MLWSFSGHNNTKNILHSEANKTAGEISVILMKLCIIYLWIVQTYAIWFFLIQFVSHTFTDHASILKVGAVVHPNAGCGAVQQSLLLSRALHTIQQDGSSAWGKGYSRSCPGTIRREPQLSADYPGIFKAPLVITHSPPLSIVTQLHSPLQLIASVHQPHCSISTLSNSYR